MKFVRYKENKTEYRGVLDDKKIKRITGSFFLDYGVTQDVVNVDDITFLPPVLSGKIIGLRANYDKHLDNPLCFMKPRSSLAAHNDKIIIPKFLDKVNLEGELAVVISKKCRNIKEKNALNYVLGYTIANDVTGLSSKFSESFTCGKWFDTFTPLGPVINTSISWENLEIVTRINGKTVQSGNTNNMFFNVPYIITYLSNIITLDAGDVILTGTPSSAVEIHHNDNIEIEIENIGILKNIAVAEND